ncbi:MAG: hypothetical protein JWP69_583 [Flaviaesturariibacter sp.]|nr:hypothetical protein [Flaviaesturariibacter sp.]
MPYLFINEKIDFIFVQDSYLIMRVYYFFALLFVVSACNVRSQDATFSIHSTFVKDSFDITITKPKIFSTDRIYSTVYYLDANLKSGKKLVELVSRLNDSIVANTIFIGIGHIGNYHQKRRRDFIPPALKNGVVIPSEDLDFGHADAFYRFLQNELIPTIEYKYKVSGTRTIIGHSFGGLFVFYSLFKPNKLFQKFIALSPSLWVNDFNIFNYEQEYTNQRTHFNSYLFLSAGTGERLNYILSGNRKMKALLEKRNYTKLQVEYTEYKGESHNSQVPLSLNYILTNRRF